jgi:hypothetical protein
MSFRQAALHCANEDLLREYRRMRQRELDNEELQQRFANQDKTNEGSINELIEEL